MPKPKMMGPGSSQMGGGGMRPSTPGTPFGGPPGAAPGGAMVGAKPRAPKQGGRAAPAAGMAGAGGAMGGAMGGAGGFKKGGDVDRPGKREREEVKMHAKGGAIDNDFGGDKEPVMKHAHGGPVIAGHTTHGMSGKMHAANEGITRGPDKKRSAGAHGADSRVHKPHSGKAS
jgi:hypothetical protein